MFGQPQTLTFLCFYYESIKREQKIRPMYECRFDERLKTRVEEFTRLVHSGFLGGMEQPITLTNFSSRKEFTVGMSPSNFRVLIVEKWVKETHCVSVKQFEFTARLTVKSVRVSTNTTQGSPKCELLSVGL